MQAYTGNTLNGTEWVNLLNAIEDDAAVPLAKRHRAAQYLHDAASLAFYVKSIEGHVATVTNAAWCIDRAALVKARGLDSWAVARKLTGCKSFMASMDSVCAAEANEEEVAAHRHGILALEQALCDVELVELAARLTDANPVDVLASFARMTGMGVEYPSVNEARDRLEQMVSPDAV